MKTILKQLYKEKKLIFTITFFFICLGLIVTIFYPSTYDSTIFISLGELDGKLIYNLDDASKLIYSPEILTLLEKEFNKTYNEIAESIKITPLRIIITGNSYKESNIITITISGKDKNKVIEISKRASELFVKKLNEKLELKYIFLINNEKTLLNLSEQKYNIQQIQFNEYITNLSLQIKEIDEILKKDTLKEGESITTSFQIQNLNNRRLYLSKEISDTFAKLSDIRINYISERNKIERRIKELEESKEEAKVISLPLIKENISLNKRVIFLVISIIFGFCFSILVILLKYEINEKG